MWERLSEDENKSNRERWRNSLNGDIITVKQFSTGTWDTFLNDRLIENFDTKREAIERGKQIMEG